jgi:hypothetical protein
LAECVTGFIVFGALMCALGAGIELQMGSFRHWWDWGWPRRQNPFVGVWGKVIGARISLAVGLVAILIGTIGSFFD